MRKPSALIFLAVLVTACAATQHAPRPSAGEQLYVAVAGGKQPMLAVIDSHSHVADRKLALGAPSADWQHVYTTAGTSLLVTDTASGDLVTTVPLGGSFHLPAATSSGVPGGISPNGRWLVVESYDGATTRMLVIDTGSMKVARHVALPGDFEFDAIDDTGSNLYLIQRLNGTDYYVRLYDLKTGSLNPDIVVDKSDGNLAMTGVRLSGIPSKDGQWLFSIYVRAHATPFIHALNLSAPFALCIDLPGAGYMDDPNEMNWSLAMTPNGRSLYAVNPAAGTVVAIDTTAIGTAGAIRTAHFQRSPLKASKGSSAALVDGATLIAGGASGVVWIDTAQLRLTGSSAQDSAIAGLGLSLDGKTVYAINDGGRIAVISTASREVIESYDPSVGTPLALMRVAAA